MRRIVQSRALRTWKHRWDVFRWNRTGRGVPVPHRVKQQNVRDYARRFKLRTLVETGTYLGDMLWAMKDVFQEIYSVELDDRLFERARAQFAPFPTIHILHGDSAGALPAVLARLTHPSLFWLDAHYSGGITARGDRETPIVDELTCILDSSALDHVVLIDDARCFSGQDGYPDKRELEALLLGKRPGWVLEDRDDMMAFHPPREHSGMLEDVGDRAID